jgi:uncharacterized membrane protein
MRIADTSRLLWGLTLMALGLVGIFSQDFASVWQPVPAQLPGRAVLAVLSGVVMAAGGAGLLWRRSLVPAASALMIYTLLWLLLLQVPRLVQAPLHEVSWGACAEIVMLVAACWVLYASHATRLDQPYVAALIGAHAVQMARIAFAVALPLIGLEHLVYAKETAAMVPAWLPYRLGWAYFTGIAHIAAGLGIAVNALPRLAATLETWMMGGFTVLVWIPSVAQAPSQRFAWTGLLISTLLTAAGWIVAASYESAPWFALTRGRSEKIELTT